MMKLLTSFCFLAFISTSAIAQDIIANPGFESWTQEAGYTDPNIWNCANPLTSPIGVTSCRQDSLVVHSGRYSCNLVTTYISAISSNTPGILTTGTIIPATAQISGGANISSRPLPVKGWFQYVPGGADTGSVSVILISGNSVIGQGLLYFTDTVKVWTAFTCKITYNSSAIPDTAQLTFQSSINAGANKSSLRLDDLSYSYTAGGSNSTCSGGRYHDFIFSTVDSSTVTYSTANGTTLAMDIFQPHGDTVTQRPVIILAHGGSFISGTRSDDPAVSVLCKNMAQRGYVTASIDYRLANSFNMASDSAYAINEIAEAISDAKAAVRFFRQDAATNRTYKINPNLIFGGGNSSGSTIFLHLAYIDSINECPPVLGTALNNNGGLNGNSGNNGYSSQISAVINLAGGLNSPSLASAGDIPSVNFQGTADPVTPYNCADFEGGAIAVRLCGLGSLTPYYQANGINYENTIYPGAGHVPWDNNSAELTQVDTVIANFLLQFVCTANQVTPPSVTLDNNQAVCSGTAVILSPNVTGGQPPYSYAWSNTANSLTCNSCQNPNTTITTAASYTVMVTDANNSTTSATINYSIANCNSGSQYCGVSTCTAGPNTQTGFPSSDSIPCAVQGTAYSYSIPFKMYSTFNYLGVHNIDSLTIDTIFNLPCGLCWSLNKASRTYAANEVGCLTIRGTTNDAVGQYNLRMVLAAYLTGNGGSSVSLTPNLVDAAGIKVWIRITTPSGTCTAVDTSLSATDQVASASCSTSSQLMVTLGSNQTVCSGSSVQINPVITNGQAPFTYAWNSTGNSLTCNNCQSPSSTITLTSTFTVTVTDGANNTATASVTYLTGGTGTVSISANGPTTFCTGGSVTLSAGNYATYSWSNGSSSATISATQSGTFSVTVTNNSGCSSTGSISVNAVAPPSAQNIIGSSNITTFQSYTYAVSQQSGISYNWIVSGGAVQSGQGTNSVSILWGGTPPYTVSVVQTNAGNCSDTSSLLVISSSCSLQVSLSISSQNPLCSGDTVTLHALATGSGNTYQWFQNGVLVAGADSATFFATAASSYQASASANGCTSLSAPYAFSFLPAPVQPAISSNATVNGCNTQPVTLSLNNTYPTYSWSNGDATSTITVTTSGSYVVTVTGSNGCHAVSAPYNLNLSIISPVEICIVSVDSATGKNIIIWNNPQLSAIDSFLVYKESSALNVFDQIGGTASGDFSTFIDLSSNPAQQADRYTIAVLDSCRHLTLQSIPHQTIHLSINQGIGTTWNLIWNAYEGFVFPSYYIYRGTTGGALTSIATISASNLSYTDLNPPSGTAYYQIGIENPNGCTPSRSSNYSQSVSNIVSTSSIGIQSVESDNIIMYSYNAGDHNVVRVESDNMGGYRLRLYEISGRQVLNIPGRNTEETILPAGLSKGVYIAEASFSNGLMKKIKVVVR